MGTTVKRPPVFFEDRVEIQLTRGKVAVVDLVDADLAQFNWTAKQGPNTWYAYRHGPKPKPKTIRLHREVAIRSGLMIASAGIEVDHEDGDGLNCRRNNLRTATKSQNMRNRPKQSNNTSGYKGVTFDRRTGRWMAQISSDGQHKFLGRFITPVAAGKAYRDAANELHGRFAHRGQK